MERVPSPVQIASLIASRKTSEHAVPFALRIGSATTSEVTDFAALSVSTVISRFDYISW
jgi:hypothetical protein